MTLATAVVVVAALYLARDVLLPITLAILLSFVLAPLVDALRRIRLGRVSAALVAALMSLCVIVSVSAVIGAQIGGLINDIPRYSDTFQDKIHSLQTALTGRLSEFATGLVRQATESALVQPPAPVGNPGGVVSTAIPTLAPIAVEIHQPSLSPIEVAQRILTPVLSPLATTGIVFVVAIFILLQREDLRDRLVRLFGARDLHRTTMAMDDAGRRLSRYFVTQLALNVVFGVLIAVGLLVIGVPNPVLWGVFATLMRFVPYIGIILSVALPLALAASVDPGWSMVAWTAALFLVCEVAIAQVIEPVVYSRSTGLSPVSVVVAAIVWGWLWGPIGLNPSSRSR